MPPRQRPEQPAGPAADQEMHGAPYEAIADCTCSATTIRARRDSRY